MLTEDVAIIGISGIYPDCDDLQGFYGNLRAGLDSVRQVSARRRADLGLDPSAECQMIASLERVDEFDHAFFGLSLREAEHMVRTSGGCSNSPARLSRTPAIASRS